VDAEVRRILDALRRLGLEEDTIIVFSSDHGDGQGAHRWNQKILFYEEQVRVPFIVSWKGVTRAGRVDEHLISNGLDLYPTLCDYAGVAPPDDLPGLSLRPLLEGREPDAWRSYVASEMPFQPSDGWNVQSLMIRTERHKYTAYSSGHYPEQLFDLQEDPGEMVNMAVDSRHADLLQQHRALAYAWCQETGYQFGRHSSHPDVPFLLPGYQFERDSM
jgi:arylsulfatase A-like enzyme